MKDRIKALRKTLSLNQTDFGSKIGVKQSAVAAYESGSRTPLDSVIVSICREFGVNERWLRTGEGEMLMHLSREEEIMRFAATVIRDPSSEFQRQALAVLAKLTPEQWQLMEEMARKLLQEQAADSPQPEEPPTGAK